MEYMDHTPSVDAQAHKAGIGNVLEVYQDPVDDVYYDVLLTIVDVQSGQYGINNFYRMQIIHEKVMNCL